MSVHTLRATRRSAEVQPPTEDRAEVSLENLVPEIHRPITEEEAATLPPSSTIPGDKRTQSPTTAVRTVSAPNIINLHLAFTAYTMQNSKQSAPSFPLHFLPRDTLPCTTLSDILPEWTGLLAGTYKVPHHPPTNGRHASLLHPETSPTYTFKIKSKDSPKV